MQSAFDVTIIADGLQQSRGLWKGLQVTFTLAADAREFRETQALERMSPEQRHSYQAGWRADDNTGVTRATIGSSLERQ